MKWASHLSAKNNIEACIDESIEAVRSQMGGDAVHLTVIFVSPQFKDKYEEIPKLIRERMDPGRFLGCSGGGIVGGGKEVEQQPALSITCANLPDVEIKGIRSDTMDLPDQDTAPGVWREWLGVNAEKKPNFIFLADPFSFRGEEFLSGVDFAYPNSGKVGGLASGAQMQGENALYLDDKIYSNGLIGMALSGNIGMDTIVAQGCRPIGVPVKISKCNGTLLTKVTDLSLAEGGWRLTLDDGSSIHADAVILATPAKISAHLVEQISPKVAGLLNQIRYVSTATVSIAYKKEDFPHSLDGFGFVVPKTEGKRILACTWTSSKFPKRVPEEYVMLRCFVGGAMREELAELDEDSIGTMVREELLGIMGIGCEPVFLKVFKYKKSNVQYQVGHASLIKSIREELQSLPGLFVTGSAYTGIGIPDCIQDGMNAAKEAIEFLANKTNT